MNYSNDQSKSKTNQIKKMKKIKRIDISELKQLFLLRIRETNSQIQEKEIEGYEARQQQLQQNHEIKPPNQDEELKCKIFILRCSHTFCERCLDEYSTRQQFCIECEEPLSHSKYIKSEPLQLIVEKHLQTIGAKQHQTYLNTKKMRDQLRTKRYIIDFSVNQNVDIRDKYFDWYEGEIMNIIMSEGKKYLVIKHKNSQSKVEIINSLSPNIAPSGYFTKRKDLKTRDEKKLDIIKNLVNEYEVIRTQRRQSEQGQEQQEQEQQQQNEQNENQQNFHNIILRHLTSVQSLPYMISLMNGAMRRSESQQRILNTLQLTINNNGQQQDGHQQEQQGQIQQQGQQQQQIEVQQEGQNQSISIANNQQPQIQPQDNPQQDNLQNPVNNNQNGNQEENTEIVIEEYEAENEDEDEELDEDQDILSNSQFSYQNLDAIQYVQEWQ